MLIVYSLSLKIRILQTRLDSTEQRLLSLQQELSKTDQERDQLSEALRRMQAAANRAIALNRFRPTIGGGGGVTQPDQGEDDFVEFKSTPFPPVVDFDQVAGGGGPAGGIDVVSLENTFQALTERIEKLERERVRYYLFYRRETVFIAKEIALRQKIVTFLQYSTPCRMNSETR